MADRGRGFFAPASAALSSGSPDIEYTVLHAKNVDVDSINNNKLAGIGSGAEEFVARDSGDLDQLRNLNVPDRLKLKVGAQVSLLYHRLTPGAVISLSLRCVSLMALVIYYLDNAASSFSLHPSRNRETAWLFSMHTLCGVSAHCHDYLGRGTVRLVNVSFTHMCT